jgi:hypothetical protein
VTTTADLFTVATLTAAVNKLPAIETKAADVYEDKGITTTVVAIEEKNGRLYLVENVDRNDDPPPAEDGQRKKRFFECAHLPASKKVMPGELQNIAPFGEEAVVNQQAQVINDKLQEAKNAIEATREFHRVGGIRGKILDADGRTVIYDLYEEFGVRKASATVRLSVAGTDVRKHCLDAKRHAEKNLAGVMVTKFKAFCGPDWFDAFTNHENVKAAFANWQAAQDRLAGDMRAGFTFGGIEFVEYDCTVSGVRFIPSEVAQVFPVGRGVFYLYNGPANYNETVNTVGKPYYSKAEPRRMGKGWDIEVQANPLAMCLYPEALYEMVAG